MNIESFIRKQEYLSFIAKKKEEETKSLTIWHDRLLTIAYAASYIYLIVFLAYSKFSMNVLLDNLRTGKIVWILIPIIIPVSLHIFYQVVKHKLSRYEKETHGISRRRALPRRSSGCRSAADGSRWLRLRARRSWPAQPGLQDRHRRNDTGRW